MFTSSMFLAISLATFVDEFQRAGVVSRPPAADQFLIVPIRVHVLVSPQLDLANCQLRDADITRIVGKLNAIWNNGGIHFGLESIVRERPAHVDRFRLMLELKNGKLEMSDFAMLFPKPSRVFDGLQVFFFHELPFNGAYLGDDCIIVSEGAALTKVSGGSDEPIPRVLGFTFGGAMGLQAHREPRTSLLSPGTSGINLDADEIEQARKVARTIQGVLTMPEAHKASQVAQKAGQTERARKLASWLGEIRTGKPGDPKRRDGSKTAPSSPKTKVECGETDF